MARDLVIAKQKEAMQAGLPVPSEEEIIANSLPGFPQPQTVPLNQQAFDADADIPYYPEGRGPEYVSTLLTMAAPIGVCKLYPQCDRGIRPGQVLRIGFDQNDMFVKLGDDHLLMEKGQPLPFDEEAASAYLKACCDAHGTVCVYVGIGDGEGTGQAWGCDLSYDYVKINAEYTT